MEQNMKNKMIILLIATAVICFIAGYYTGQSVLKSEIIAAQQAAMNEPHEIMEGTPEQRERLRKMLHHDLSKYPCTLRGQTNCKNPF